MGRNRRSTEERILQAAQNLIGTEGFNDWGINRLAREAQVDKVLLYRYFENLSGVYERTCQNVSLSPSLSGQETLEDVIRLWWNFLEENNFGKQILLWKNTSPAIMETANLIRAKFHESIHPLLDVQPLDPWADCLFSSLCDQMNDPSGLRNLLKFIQFIPQKEDTIGQKNLPEPEELPTELL